MLNRFKFNAYSSIWGVLDVVFPPSCAGCNQSGIQLCSTCSSKIQILEGLLCQVCGLPVANGTLCAECKKKKYYFDQLRSWSVFGGAIRDVLHQLKYQKNISLGFVLAKEMKGFVQKLNWPVDMVIPIPLGSKRYKERGYNQVEMIAKPLSLAFNWSYQPNGIVRIKETRSQVGLSRDERIQNVDGVFQTKISVAEKAILLMDDVATTGSTLSSAAKSLLNAGAKNVYALTVARALPHHSLLDA